MNPVARMLFSLLLGLTVYTLYWKLWGRSRGKAACLFRWKPSDYALRQKRSGMVRIYVGWVLVFLTYAIAIEDSGAPFSSYWWQETLLAGDWIGVLLFSAIMSFAEWHRAAANGRQPALPDPTAAGDGRSPSP